MRKFLPTIVSLSALISCSSQTSSPNGNGDLGTSTLLTKLWSLSSPKISGQTTLIDNLFLGGTPKITAIDIKNHQIALNLPIEINNQLCGSVVPRGIMRWERILWVCRP
ncbi:hypothetical protein ACI3L1_19715, partial [Deinococcus sp. SM5_A1]|uniref:hypothetical protein n=1 Tax=Deinococcus sp. SM5_A1 TaxID=3379094 RepID=UPI00385B58E8